MASAQAEAKKKFGGLFGGKDDGPDSADAPDEEGDGEEEADEPEEAAGGYDVKACANDIMAAVKAGDVDALAEALEELLEKAK